MATRSGIAILLLAALIAWAHAAPARPLWSPAKPPEDLPPPIPVVDKDMKVNVKNIAALLKKGHTAGAKKLAADAARNIKNIDDFDDLELFYRPRNKGGLGWGSNPQPVPNLDSLERRTSNMTRMVTPADLQQAAANEEAAYWIAALGELELAAKLKLPGANKKPWDPFAQQVRDGGLELAKASAAGDAAAMKSAAIKINNACNSCHNIHRN
jgi:hypothetical protein